MLKKTARKTFIYDIYEFLYRFADIAFEEITIQKWQKNGEKLPVPHAIKRKIIKDLIQRNKIRTFVETGTYKGYMIDAVKDIVPEIYSVEIDRFLASKVTKRFRRSNHVKIIQGDSSIEVKSIITKLKNPTLFWLDAHFSGGITGKGEEDSPLEKELKFIKEKAPAGSIIAIDDIADCNGQNGYPLLEEMLSLSNKHELKNNIAVFYL
jgi:hypothetical protein